MRRVLGLAGLVLLAACSSPAPMPVVVRPDVPASLLACAAAPVPPDLNVPRWDQVLAGYLLDLGAAGDDCRAKLGGVRGLVGR
jgi:hypothetical protein